MRGRVVERQLLEWRTVMLLLLAGDRGIVELLLALTPSGSPSSSLLIWFNDMMRCESVYSDSVYVQTEHPFDKGPFNLV